MRRTLAAIKFRLAVPADAPVIAGMSQRLIETGLGWSWTPQRVEGCISARETLSVVAVDGDEIVGFGILDFGDETAHLSLFAVEEAYRRHGIGSGMFEWLRQSALTAGIAIIRLELRAGNLNARAFYRSIGFEQTGRIPGYYRGREAALRMALSLRVHPAGRMHGAR